MASFTTILAPSEGVYKEKGSTFLGFAFPLQNEDDFKTTLQLLKQQHPNAVHFCYGFRFDPNGSFYRYSDDGEPSNTGGKPIYGQLLSFNVTDVAVVVVRYYGGTKLGVGGLITAYKEAAKDALQQATLKIQELTEPLTVVFEYGSTAAVNQIIHHQKLSILSQDFQTNCHLTLAVPVDHVIEIQQVFETLQGVLSVSVDK